MCKERVFAYHKSLIRVIRIRDLGKILLVEQGKLQRTILNKLTDCWSPKSGDPFNSLLTAKIIPKLEFAGVLG